MSRNNKNKKSTSKYRKFKVSPLIPVIAVIEVIVLIAISTYAWFVVSREKEAKTGVITVNADSGLDIDFKNANYNDEINIWDYVEDEFSFEPVTSLDGRNVFVPTSGTFDKTNTNEMVFRDATINDINDKYLNVDFMLTNTTQSDMDVYLGNESKFKVWNNGEDSNSRALRLAFYTNDGEHGKVDSSILANTNDENAILEASNETCTVYFEKPDNWDKVYAYLWRTDNNVDYPAVSWPGSTMTKMAGKIYSYSFNNPSDAAYTFIVFSNGEKDNAVVYNGSNSSTCTQTRDLNIVDGHLYKLNGAKNSEGEVYTTKTIYVLKPSGWNTIYANIFKSGTSLTGFPGDQMTDCGAGIYSYTFPSDYTTVKFSNGTNTNESNAISIISTENANYPPLYYFNSTSIQSKTPITIKHYEKTIYFYNSQNFSQPYAKIKTASNVGASSGITAEIPMTNLSAGVFYCTVPSVYSTVVFEDGTGATQNTKYTQSKSIYDGYIYKPNTKTGSGWTVTEYSYADYVGTAGQSPYAVISPGVSAGFQRAYTPVVDIAPTNGVATQLVPAFASSIDNYIKGSGNPLFTIPAGGMKDLSMIIWLEGTDDDCTNSNYASLDLLKKEIELYLEFATTNVYRDSDNVPRYTYRFYDKTREVWTSDRLTNAAGISIAPVMQLYDATAKRGYLMHAASTTGVGGKKKVDLWECQAPATLYTSNHDLYFRRVDPYNEDEVWNYWHPGAAVSDAASVVGGKQYISFTAFADGAPASSNQDAGGVNGNDQYVQAATTAHTPAKSCGGLWGTYETTLFTAVDGTDGFRLNQSDGVLTMHYTYTYPNSGTTHEIEYKASGAYGQFYYFVIPKTLLNSSVNDYRFNRYWDFNSNYAMNIYKRNSTMAAHVNDIFTMGSSTMTGYYAMLTRNPGGNEASNNYTYFGQGLLYVNISYKDEGNNKNMFNGTGIKFKLYYWNSSNTGQNVNHYMYTNNGTFSLTNFNGYVSVVPKYSGTTYFELDRCDTNNNWTITDGQKNKSVPIAYDDAKHNLVAWYWTGNDNKTVGCDYNADNTGYSWPTIPSYD